TEDEPCFTVGRIELHGALAGLDRQRGLAALEGDACGLLLLRGRLVGRGDGDGRRGNRCRGRGGGGGGRLRSGGVRVGIGVRGGRRRIGRRRHDSRHVLDLLLRGRRRGGGIVHRRLRARVRGVHVGA